MTTKRERLKHQERCLEHGETLGKRRGWNVPRSAGCTSVETLVVTKVFMSPEATPRGTNIASSNPRDGTKLLRELSYEAQVVLVIQPGNIVTYEYKM